MRQLTRKIRASDFSKSVSILVSGTFLGQAIALLSVPILTRLYEPAGFAVLALFMAFMSSLSPGISGRYEIAIAVARTQQEGTFLLAIASWMTLGLSTLLFAIVLVFDEQLRWLLNAEMLGNWLYIIPITLFFFGMNMVMRRYANGRRDYRGMSQLSVVQPISTAALAILFGVLGLKEDGLIASTIIASIVATLFVLWRYRKDLTIFTFRVTKAHYQLAVKYKQFPIFDAPTSMLDGITISLPIFYLARDYPETIVAYFALMTRVAFAPLAFLSQAVAQVHLRKVADMVQASIPAGIYLMKITTFLLTLSAIPATIFLVSAPNLFAYIFGEPWREAGSLLIIIMPALVIKFVVSTLSPVFSSTGNNHLAAIWKILVFLVTLIMFIFCSGRLEVRELFFTMMVIDSTLYLLYYFLIWYALKNPKEIY